MMGIHSPVIQNDIRSIETLHNPEQAHAKHQAAKNDSRETELREVPHTAHVASTKAI
jgi:hypothetical protein